MRGRRERGTGSEIDVEKWGTVSTTHLLIMYTAENILRERGREGKGEESEKRDARKEREERGRKREGETGRESE